MLRLSAHPVACCWMLLRVVAQSLKPVKLFSQQLPTVSFDPFAQLFQHCWGHARSLRMVCKDVWVISLPRCTAGPNIVGATMLGVVAAVCSQPKVRLMSRLSRECTCKSCNNYYCIRFASTGNSGTQILY